MSERDYERGFHAGWSAFQFRMDAEEGKGASPYYRVGAREESFYGLGAKESKPKRKRKLSEWQKYVKVNSKKPRFKYKSGSKRGRVNFKALGIAFRKTPAGKKKRR